MASTVLAMRRESFASICGIVVIGVRGQPAVVACVLRSMRCYAKLTPSISSVHEIACTARYARLGWALRADEGEATAYLLHEKRRPSDMQRSEIDSTGHVQLAPSAAQRRVSSPRCFAFPSEPAGERFMARTGVSDQLEARSEEAEAMR